MVSILPCNRTHSTHQEKTVLKWLAGVYIMTKWPGWGLRPETSNLYTHLQKKDGDSQPHLRMKSDASWSQWTFCWYLPRRAPPQTTCWGFQVSPNLILKWLRGPISVQYFMLVTSHMLVEYNCRRQPMMFLLTVPWLRTSCIYLHVTWLGLEEKAQQMQLLSTRLFSRYLEREPPGSVLHQDLYFNHSWADLLLLPHRAYLGRNYGSFVSLVSPRAHLV